MDKLLVTLLRRVLLSSLQGAGIVAIRIDGVEHEFGTINNVKEEVSEIILNLKRSSSLRLRIKKKLLLFLRKMLKVLLLLVILLKVLDVEVLNPDHVICNLSSGGSIKNGT